MRDPLTPLSRYLSLSLSQIAQSQTCTNIKPGSWRRLMTLINGCKNMTQLKQTHALFITHGLASNVFAMSKILAFSALYDVGYASRVFGHCPSHNSFFYNTLIRAYSRSHDPHLAIYYFNLMVKDDGVVVDYHTFPFVLIACGNGVLGSEGRKVHAWVVKNGLGSSDGYVQTALLRFYCECRDSGDARKVFDEIHERDVVKWNVLMNGYVKVGMASECLSLFRDMLSSDVDPDKFVVTTALTACAKLGTLRQGKWIHDYIVNRGDIVLDAVVRTALVDMYAKCGCIDMAMEVFEGMPERNEYCWAVVIGGLAVHGYAAEAISCLDRMQAEDGLRPDGVALLGVLSACSHAGHVEEGLFLLENMESKYGVAPKYEHYGCVVDMFCKAGRLNEALEIIRRMPMKPLASVWGALLSGSRLHKNVELAELAVKELELLGEGRVEHGIYVELSNIYLASRKSEDAIRVRKMIGDRGAKKTPGCSAIEVNGEVNEFVSGDAAHRHLSRIHAALALISFDSLHLSVKTSKFEEEEA